MSISTYVGDANFADYLENPKDYPLYMNRPLDKSIAENGRKTANRILNDIYKVGALVSKN